MFIVLDYNRAIGNITPTILGIKVPQTREVLGNLFSGLMLLAGRPFNIKDRIALITWQYGKFAPSMSHGWLEPAYTGVVKGITLTYTRLLTVSSAILKIPNSVVTQSLIMNLSNGKQRVIATQFEAPKKLDPEELHTRLNSPAFEGRRLQRRRGQLRHLGDVLHRLLSGRKLQRSEAIRETDEDHHAQHTSRSPYTRRSGMK